MHSTVKAIHQALQLVSFPNDDLKNATNDLVIELGTDLETTEGGYIEGIDVAKAHRVLSERLTQYNVEQEQDLDEVIKNVNVDETDIGIND